MFTIPQTTMRRRMSYGAPLDHVADANARLSIDPTGKTAGYRVIQDDGPTTYEFQGSGADADAGLWVIGADTASWNGAYLGPADHDEYAHIGGGSPVSGPGNWIMSPDYQIFTTQSYPWEDAWVIFFGVGSPPAPTVARDPLASEANWVIV